VSQARKVSRGTKSRNCITVGLKEARMVAVLLPFPNIL